MRKFIIALTSIATMSTPLIAVDAQAQAPTATPQQQPASVLTPADRGWIARIADTLNAVHTLKARFQQTAPDGRTSEGEAWLDRPGRMRFQYDAPSPLLLTAANGQVVFQDRQLQQTTTIPLEKTPLGLLLREHLTLSGDVRVIGFQHQNGYLTVTVVRAATPGDGSLTLVLADNPLTLRGWTVVDPQQRTTQVRLSNIVTGGSFADGLFQPAPDAK